MQNALKLVSLEAALALQASKAGVHSLQDKGAYAENLSRATALNW